MQKVATIIKCMDHRQNGFFKEWLRENCIEDSDIISVAGSVKELAGNNETIKNWILNMIEISHVSHGSNEIVLTAHSTCGAYKIEDEKEERKVQTEDMKKAEALIKERFPGVKVIKFWLKLRGDHENATGIDFIPVD